MSTLDQKVLTRQKMMGRINHFSKEPDPVRPPICPLNYCTEYHKDLPEDSYVRRLRFRPSNYIVRTYSPKGLTKSGLYTEMNEKWPRVWAHVLACCTCNVLGLKPGDLVLFRRHTEDLIGFDTPSEEWYPGDQLPIEILNYRAILALIEDSPVSVRV